MNTKRLRYELDEELRLKDKYAEGFLNRLKMDEKGRQYIDDNLLPSLQRNIDHQIKIVDTELIKLLGDKYEKWKKEETNQF